MPITWAGQPLRGPVDRVVFVFFYPYPLMLATTSSLPADCRLPVTVLSGFVGAGKTTLLHQLLHHRAGQRLAVLTPDHHAPAGSCHVRTTEKIIHLATATDEVV